MNAAVVDVLHPRADRRERGHERLGDAGRAVPRASQLPAARRAEEAEEGADPIWPFTTTVRSVIARNGQFTYDDHTTPWLVVCRNLNVSVFKGFDTYRGTAQFTNGSVKILQYDAFPTDMQTRFKIDGGKIVLEDINLKSLGASTKVTGYVDIPNWPTMLYNVQLADRLPDPEGDLFQGHELHRRRAGDVRRHLPLLQDPDRHGARAQGHASPAPRRA